MTDLTNAAKDFKKQLLAKSWGLKDQVDSYVLSDDSESIKSITW